jgi:REP element-mobilizing transposase RayT
VDEYVIMPNHIHLLLSLVNQEGGASPSPTVTDVVCALKSIVSRICKQNYGIEKIFQRSFYDHVMRGRQDYENLFKYILENP